MWRDLRYAVRSLSRRPTLMLAATLALGVAIGANAAIFSLVDSLWLRPAGIGDVGRTVRVFSTSGTTHDGQWSFPEYVALRDRTTSFGGVVAIGRRGAIVLNAQGRPELVRANVVSVNFFDTLRIRALHGRLFTGAIEMSSTAAPGVVLGHAFWVREFGGDMSVVGRSVNLGAGAPVAVTVLGVLPASFRELDAAADRDLWMTPQTWRLLSNSSDFEDATFRWFEVVAVRRPGVSVRTANAEVASLAGRLATEFPSDVTGRSARVVSDFDYRRESGGANAVELVALVLLVVIITCVNVANLMLSRAIAQVREAAVRVALGASRRHLLRQVLAECSVLGLLGAAAGLLIGVWLIRVLPALLVPPPGFHSPIVFAVDGRVFAFTALVTIVTTALVSLAPGWLLLHSDLNALIKGGPATAGPGPHAGRLGSALVVAQVAVSLVLLSSAAVLARSFIETGRVDLGFTRGPMITAWATPGSMLRDAGRAAIDRLSAIAGVTHVAVAIRAPLSLSGGGLAQPVTIPGASGASGDTAVDVKFGAVSADYFETLGVRVVAGRGFAPEDDGPGPPVVVVSERFAARFLDPRTGVGSLVRIGGARGVDHRVIGVVRDTIVNRLGEPPEPYFYLPYWRGGYSEITFFITAAADAPTAPLVRDTLVAVDPRLEPRRVITMAEYLRYTAADYRATAALAVVLGTVGLLLTALGVYGVVAYRTAGRTREIGIRVALGAARREVLALVFADGGRIMSLGVLIGVPASLVATRLIESLLFGLNPWDAAPLTAAAMVVAVTVAVATLVPAWRATRISAGAALRE